MDSQVLRDKIAFFEELNALNKPMDEEDDRFSKEEEEFRAKSRAIFSSRGKNNRAPPRPQLSFAAKNPTLPTPKRSFSAPTPVGGKSRSQIVIEATPEPRGPTK